MTQNSLFPSMQPPRPPWSAEDWSRFLSETTGNPVEVSYGRARREVIRSRGYWNDPRGLPIEIRLSDIFIDAPDEVRSSVAKWLKSGKRASRACKVLDDWIADTLRALPPRKRRKSAVEPCGLHHDLGPLMVELTQGAGAEFSSLDFEPKGLPELTWGRRQKSSARRSLQLGSYNEEHHRIRLHPVLDQANVPRWIVKYVLFHELLHAHRAAVDPPRSNGNRRAHHDRKFRLREASYVDFERARAWQDARIQALIRSATSGKPLGKLRRFLGFNLGS